MRTERLHFLGAGVLLLGAAGLAWHGQPTPAEKWQFLAPVLQPRLTNREVYIEPAELVQLMHDDYIQLLLIDVRDERDWNLFHLWGAERIAPERLRTHRKRFATLAHNAVVVFVGNDEALASAAWKEVMVTASRPNAYILSGGLNRWLEQYAGHGRARRHARPAVDGNLRHAPRWALGARHPAALPDPHQTPRQDFPRKVRLQKRVVRKGGCG